MGCSLCSEASLMLIFAKMATLCSPFLLSLFPWVGSGNLVVIRCIFCQISLQTILSVGRERGGNVSTTLTSWGGGGGEICGWWQMEGLAAGPSS